MAIKTINKEMLDLEHRFWDAMQRKDGQTAKAMTHANCVVVGAQGASTIDRETMGKLTVEGNWTLEQYEIDPTSVQALVLDDTTRVVAYKVTERLTVDGEKIKLQANDSSVWVLKNGEWLCALHTESVAGDPFGRDKQPSKR
jgi:hypothetical protein